MTAKQQRGVMIALLIGIFIALVKPDVFRKWVLEVATEQVDKGREHDSESDSRPSPQKDTIPFTRASSLTA